MSWIPAGLSQRWQAASHLRVEEDSFITSSSSFFFFTKHTRSVCASGCVSVGEFIKVWDKLLITLPRHKGWGFSDLQAATTVRLRTCLGGDLHKEDRGVTVGIYIIGKNYQKVSQPFTIVGPTGAAPSQKKHGKCFGLFGQQSEHARMSEAKCKKRNVIYKDHCEITASSLRDITSEAAIKHTYILCIYQSLNFLCVICWLLCVIYGFPKTTKKIHI